ncbi:MAG: hypothetical protein R6U93_05065 [Dehalococcoidia bacterium]
MPRKFDDAKKKEWLELYDEGKSEKWIAKRAGCDVRTVKNAINEARLKRDVVVARIELVKDALQKHQEGLLEELDQIKGSLVVPEREFAVLSWTRGENSIFSGPDEQVKLKSCEDSAMRRLLKQHLKNDKLWRVLTQWEKARINHLVAKLALQRKTVTLLEEKTNYNLIDGDGPLPFMCSYTAGHVIYKNAIDMAFAAPDENAQKGIIERMEAATTVNTNNGDVVFGSGSILAVAPGSERATRQHLLDALRDLGESPEAKAVVETYQALEQITTKARQVVEDIRLLGLVLGQCAICRRLGM